MREFFGLFSCFTLAAMVMNVADSLATRRELGSWRNGAWRGGAQPGGATAVEGGGVG